MNSPTSYLALGVHPLSSRFAELHYELNRRLGQEAATLFGFENPVHKNIGGKGGGDGHENISPSDKLTAPLWMDGYNNIVNSGRLGTPTLDQSTIIQMFPFMAKGDTSYNNRWRLDANLQTLVKNRRITQTQKNNVKTAKGSPNFLVIRDVMKKLGINV